MNAKLLSHETVLLEWEKEVAHRLLAKRFTATELKYLQQDEQFQEVVTEMNSIDAFEITAALGDHLLIERDKRNALYNVVQQSFSE